MSDPPDSTSPPDPSDAPSPSGAPDPSGAPGLETPSDVSSPGLVAFADYLSLCEAGDPPSFEDYCAERPDLAADLRRIRAGWERAAGVLEPDSASPAPEASPGAGGPFAPDDRYEVLGEVGRGGMGVVLRVRDRELRRMLAMKVQLPERERDRRAASRFSEEAQVTGQLEHPGIVPIYDMGVDRHARSYYTMPLVRGRDGAEVFALARAGKDGWTTTRALGVVLRVCEAMTAAHAKGVIHRDLKPANVMVGEYEEVYVLDWGLARVMGSDQDDARADSAPAKSSEGEPISSARRDAVADSPDSSLRTHAGQVVGTPSFMAPEQARGEPIDARSDVYSVGAMLYLLLAGTRPYEKPTQPSDATTTLAQLLAGAPEPLRSRARHVPPALAAICERAMEREPEQRYATMGALASDLRAFLESRVVSAYRTGALAELHTWVRRNRAFAATIVALFIALVAGLAATLNLKARSDANASLALGAVDRMLTRVGKETMADVPKAQPVRRALLEDAVEFYGSLLELQPGDAELVRASARAQYYLALTVDWLGDTERAEEIVTESIARLRVAAGSESSDWSWASPVADHLKLLGDYHIRRGQFELAKADFEAALAELADVAPRSADDKRDLRGLLARIHGSLGSMHIDPNSEGAAVKSEEAIGHLMLATDTYRELRQDADPAEDQLLRRHLSTHLEVYGIQLTRLGRNAEAEAVAREVLELRETALVEEDDKRDATNRLIIALSNLAVPVAEQGKPEAGAIFERIIEPATQLTKDYPNLPVYRRNLAMHHMNLGSWRSSNGERPAGIEDFRVAIEVLEPVVDTIADDMMARSLWFGAHHALVQLLPDEGEFDAVAELAASFEDRGWQDPFNWGRLAAQAYARCAESTGNDAEAFATFADQAVAVLRKGLEQGEFDPSELGADWAEALRGYPPFDALQGK